MLSSLPFLVLVGPSASCVHQRPHTLCMPVLCCIVDSALLADAVVLEGVSAIGEQELNNRQVALPASQHEGGDALPTHHRDGCRKQLL